MAQPVPTKLPDSVHLFPAGGQRGTTVRVCVGAEQTPPHALFFIRGTGVSGDSELEQEVQDSGEPSPRRAPTEIPISYPRQWSAEVCIAPDAPVGTAHWDMFCASGGSSGSLPFVVGQLPELIETESNSTPNTAEAIDLPVTLNGQIHGERDLDYYRFSLKAGQTVYCEVLARRLGSRLEPAVSILDANGRAVTHQEDSLGDDPLLAFRAPVDGIYYLQVGNVSVHGSTSHVYRINLTHKPVAPWVYPLGASAGRPTEFSFVAMSGDGNVQVIKRELTLPADGGDIWLYDDDELANIVPLRVLPPETPMIWAEHSHRGGHKAVKPGEVVNGRLLPNSSDVHIMKVESPQPLDIRVVAPSKTSAAALIAVEIENPSGKNVARIRPSTTSGAVRAYHFLASPVAGNYRITLQNVGGISTDHRVHGYQLEILPARPDFQLQAGSDCRSVTQGSSLEIPITVDRRGGFNGEVTIHADGLPEGVTVENSVIAAGKNELKLKLTVPENQASARYEMRLTGTALVADRSVSRPVRVRHRGHDSLGRAAYGLWRDVIALTVRHKPVFRLYCEEAYQYAHRGTIYPYLMTVERLNDFKEPVFIQRGDRQNRDLDGIEFVKTMIGPEQSRFMMPIYLPETMHINIQSQSQLYTQAYASFTDSYGQRQHALVVAEKRNMLRTMPTVVKLNPTTPELSGRPGEIVIAEFALERTSNMRNAMHLELASADSPHFDVAAQKVDRGQKHLEVPVRVPGELSPGHYRLSFRASGPLDARPDQTAVTSATVTVRVQ